MNQHNLLIDFSVARDEWTMTISKAGKRTLSVLTTIVVQWEDVQSMEAYNIAFTSKAADVYCDKTGQRPQIVF